MAKNDSANDGPRRDAARQGNAPQDELRYPFKRTRTVVILCAASAVLLTLAFPPANLSTAAYLAPVPLLVAIVLARTTRAAVLSSLLAGAIFFAVNCYWVFLVTIIGGIATIAYLSAYFAALAWGIRRIRSATRWPMAIIAPILWVSLEYARSIIITGFPWLYLGHTQYANLTLIQISDVTGAYGVSFLVAMTSGLIVDVLTRPLFVRYGKHVKFSRSIRAMTLVVIAAWLVTIAYGSYRLGQTTSRNGPTVAVIQGSVPQFIKRKPTHYDAIDEEEFIMEQYVPLTEKAIAGAEAIDLIVWPETMVPGAINRQFLRAAILRLVPAPSLAEHLFETQSRYRGYWREVKRLADKSKANMLVGVASLDFTGAHGIPVEDYGEEVPREKREVYIIREGTRYNSALLIKPDTPDYAYARRYDKVHLVLFGEYVPFRWWPGLYSLLQKFTPYPFDYSLTPGKAGQKPFEQDGFRYNVPICYEGAMPMRIREMAMSGGEKQIDFLVNISNDGWFVNPEWFPAWAPATELDQHLNLYVFRAVENRLGIVRAVNTGISGFITPGGAIEEIVRAPNGRRHNVGGYLVGRVQVDSRVTFYSRCGDVFALLCFATSVILVIFTVGRHKRTQKRSRGEK